ncbi:MAG: LysR family transcriptional regulator [Synergistaceae bacterium]|nr:LysR family transcriptional regulator [Synergistaceae bacterium]
MLDPGIEAFLAIVRTGSFSKAADILALTQSSASQRLKKLEKELGYPLIDRQKGKKLIVLTPAGRSFLVVAERMFSALQDIKKTSLPDLQLRICGVDSANTFVLPELYKALLDNDPMVRLTIESSQTPVIYRLLEEQKIDAGFVHHEYRLPNVRVELFFREEMLIIRSFAPNLPKEVSVEELDPHNEIRFDWGPRFQFWHDMYWNPADSYNVGVDTVALIEHMLRFPEQWAFVPFSVLKRWTNARFSFQRLRETPPERVCYLITHRYPRHGIEDSLDILRKTARSMGFLP